MTGDDFRLLGTGSRTWKNGLWVFNGCDQVLQLVGPKRLVIVHGGCPDGGDRWFDIWADEHEPLGVRKEVYEAHWYDPCNPKRCKLGHRRVDKTGRSYCPAAGIYRNELMGDLGADVCHAYIRDDSNGATQMANYAERKGILTLRWNWGQAFTRNRKERIRMAKWHVWSVFPNGNSMVVEESVSEKAARAGADRRNDAARRQSVSGHYVALPDGTTPADETAENTGSR